MTRKKFIKVAVLGGAMLSHLRLHSKERNLMKYELKKLPYNIDSLEPHIDKETVEIHYGKHHATYLSKLNTALEGDKSFEAPSDLEELLRNISKAPVGLQKAIRNNGGGVWNHTFYWDGMNPEKSTPTGKLLEKIKSKFGTYEDFKKKFSEESALFFGSGWVWLCEDERGDLVIVGTPNQDSPIMGDFVGLKNGLNPLIAIDLWEHAYYIKYQNRRPEYIANFLDIIDWNKASDRMRK